MSPNKNLLHHLLQQDQEPFHIRDYISDRRTKLRTSARPQQLTPLRKPLRETTSNSSSSVIHFPVTFCKNACFTGKHDSPDLTGASPVVYFRKSPVKLLHIPSKTAALLLEAALRIHKNSSAKHARRFRTDFGFFGSVFKKLTLKTRNRNDRELEVTGVPPLPVKNIFRRDASRKPSSGSGKLRWDSLDLEEVLSDSDMGFYCHERRSDAVWSEDKSLDTETSCSSSSNTDATQFAEEQTQSPSRRRSPDFSFLPPSPSRRTVKDEDEEEEEKEQCSPVCVLDPLFEYEDDTNEDENDGHGRLQCSYASVQRKKQQLLQKLRRFETLADLNPEVLELTILEGQLFGEHDLQRLDEDGDDIVSQVSAELLRPVLEKSGFRDPFRIPVHMKRLISDLIAEEEMKDEWLDDTNTNGVVNAVCAKLDAWKDVEPNTIDMMVGQDFKQESHRWKTNHDQGRVVAMDIESTIFGSLVKELLSELMQ